MLIHLHIIVTSCYNIKTEWLFEVHTLVVLSSSAWALKIMGMHKNKVVNIWSNILTKCIVIILKCVSSVQWLSRVQLCDPMSCRTPGLPVHYHLPESTQTHVHRVHDAIQTSHPGSFPSPPAPNPYQHQSLFQWVNSSHEVAKVLEFQL